MTRAAANLFEWAAQCFAADLDARLMRRKVGREQRNARSRRSAQTLRHIAFADDRLLNELVPL